MDSNKSTVATRQEKKSQQTFTGQLSREEIELNIGLVESSFRIRRRGTEFCNFYLRKVGVKAVLLQQYDRLLTCDLLHGG